MNERIRELAKKYLVNEYFTRYGESVQHEHYEFEKEELVEFIEEIVRECIRCRDDIEDIQKHYLKYGINQELGASQCIEVIKTHFGVEG